MWLHALQLGVLAGEANVLCRIARGQQQQQQQQQEAAAAAATVAAVTSHQLLQLSALYHRLFTMEVTSILGQLQSMQQQQQQQQFATLQAWIANTGMITSELLSLVSRLPVSFSTSSPFLVEAIMAVTPAGEAARAAAAAAGGAVDPPAIVSPVVQVESATPPAAGTSRLPQQQQQQQQQVVTLSQGSSMSEVQDSWQQLLEGQLPVSIHLPLHRMVAQCVRAVMDYSLAAAAAPQQQQQQHQLCHQLWALDWQGLAQHVLLTHAWLVQVRLAEMIRLIMLHKIKLTITVSSAKHVLLTHAWLVQVMLAEMACLIMLDRKINVLKLN
jgi:hypothetical protein